MNIVVTGASRGIGYDAALQLAEAGHQVIAISRNKHKLEALKEAANDSSIHIIAADLTTDLSAIAEEIRGKFSHIDRIANNAGVLINKPFQQLETADLLSLFQVNVFAPIQLIQALLPMLSKGAHIVNIGSMGGFQGSSKFPGLAAYSASKAALANFSECLAEELKDQGIAVNCLALGAVQTDMLAEAFPGYQAPVTSKQMASFLVNFLLEGHQFYNGKVLPVSVSTP